MALQEHIAREVLNIFLVALPERYDEVDSESEAGTDASPESRSTIRALDEVLPLPDNSPELSPGLDEDETPTVRFMDSVWQAVWASPRLKTSVRETYSGPADDDVLKNLASRQILTRRRPISSRARPILQRRNAFSIDIMRQWDEIESNF